MSDTPTTLLEFPCRFPIKAMGPAESGLEDVVVEIVERHAPGVDEAAIRVRSSRGGKWIAITIVIEAQSKPQLDAIYRELSAHELVAWAL
ncbi:YbeD family protein [Thiocystis violacea]|uniref:YbeD family protein n=1 Tax=Thiocystis violacea TaxID=13725 RepID=UPI0019072B30|nr:DUF493 domain-containing protein [Thiocystis violacea]MBK1724220.1 transcriptional regulator [Thiocystis violacea]